MDLALSLAIVALVAAIAAAYAVRVVTRGRARHARVEREGKSALVGKGAMEGFYWTMQPIAVFVCSCGIGADTITWLSLVLGLAAGGAFAAGHLGIGAALAIVGAAMDALDGLVARHSGTASDAGEILDAAIDRVVDFALIAGLAFAFRGSPIVLVLALLAILASFLVSYSSARAYAQRVTPPRGSMRRAERAILVVGGAALTPIVERVFHDERALPVVIALGVIAVVGNFSAIARFAAIRAALRRREAEAAMPHAAE